MHNTTGDVPRLRGRYVCITCEGWFHSFGVWCSGLFALEVVCGLGVVFYIWGWAGGEPSSSVQPIALKKKKDKKKKSPPELDGHLDVRLVSLRATERSEGGSRGAQRLGTATLNQDRT